MLNDFRSRLNAYCRSVNKTQRDLAQQSGFSYASLSKKLNGQRSLIPEDIKLLLITLLDWEVFQDAAEVLSFYEVSSYSWASLLSILEPAERTLLARLPKAEIVLAKSFPHYKHNLPELSTNFIGRTAELAQIKALLQEARWLTLVGTAGSGKTRLALEVVRLYGPTLVEGSWLIGLTGLDDPKLLSGVIAASLGIKEQVGKSLTETLIQNLKPRKLLLLLDNCEHLLSVVGNLLETLLADCPFLRIVVTSREKLGGRYERLFSVGPLSLPTPEILQETGESRLTKLRTFESVQLFETRAKQVLTSFKLQQKNAQAVQEICQHLDGIPLALELAAARLKALSITQIQTRLNERFRLLKWDNSSATANPVLFQHQTLKAMVDWSYELLQPAEQLLFTELTVFASSFSLEAACAVCAESLENSAIEVGLESLVAKNLLQRQTKENGSSGSERFLILETLRHYGLEILEQIGRKASLQNRHFTYYRALAEQAKKQLRKAEQAYWLNRLETEHNNFRAALEWSRITPGEGGRGLELAAQLWPFWFLRGYFSEGRYWLSELLVYQEQASLIAQIDGLNGLAGMEELQNDYAAAQANLLKALELSRLHADKRGQGIILSSLGDISYRQRNYHKAQEFYEQVIEFVEVSTAHSSSITNLNNLAMVANLQYNYTKAVAYCEKGLLQAQQFNDHYGLALLYGNLAKAKLNLKQYAEASNAAKQSMAHGRELGENRCVITAFLYLGEVGQLQGNDKEAQNYYQQALELSRNVGSKDLVAKASYCLALVALIKGIYSKQIITLLYNSLSLQRELDDKEGLAQCLIVAAIWAAQEGHLQKAREWLLIATSLAETNKLDISSISKAGYDWLADKLITPTIVEISQERGLARLTSLDEIILELLNELEKY